MDTRAFEREITSDFVAAIDAVPGLHVTRFETRGEAGDPIDAEAELDIQGKHMRVWMEAKKSLYPRDLQNIIHRLKQFRDVQPKGAPSMLVLLAETISPGARDALQAEGVGYFDTSGSLYLPAPNAFVYVEKPTTRKQEKVIGSVFDGRRTQVLEALWEAGSQWISNKAIVERTGAAPSLVTNTLQELERQDWIDTRGIGPAKERRLSDWEGLLDAWTRHQSFAKPIIISKYYVPRPRLGNIMKDLDHACAVRNLPYEFTGEIAGNTHASLLSNVTVVRCRLPIGRDAISALDDIDAQPVADGWNLATIDAGSGVDLRFRQRIDDLWFASPLRTYLDLLRTGGRGKDAAAMLREQKLRLS